MSHSDFIHLRVHSCYSLLEGAIKIEDLVNRTKDFNMPAVAITDTGNLFGALEFSKACINEGIQPIIGTQLDVSPFQFTFSIFNFMANVSFTHSSMCMCRIHLSFSIYLWHAMTVYIYIFL